MVEMNLTEMEKLVSILMLFDIPFEVVSHWSDTPQVWYPCREHPVCDVISFYGSYGGSEGLLEIMGLVSDEDDDVEGWLTAKEVGLRIIKHYNDHVVEEG